MISGMEMSQIDIDQEETKWTAICIISIIITFVFVMIVQSPRTYAENSAGTPESGTTSYIKSLYTTLQSASYGSDTNTPDWGTYWNRISTSSQWAPSGTAAIGEVKSSKTFYGSSRSQLAGTFSPSTSTATPADVASGKTFVGNTGAQQTGTMYASNPGNCPTQAYHDSYGAPVTQTTNCTANITWTVPGGGITGTDKQDPVSTLIWSQPLLNTAGTIGFTAGAPTSFTWDNSGANNTSRTAIQLCSDRGNGWRLPTQKEFMQAYIDGSFFNLAQPSYYFWSAVRYSATSINSASLSDGNQNSNFSTDVSPVRCVR